MKRIFGNILIIKPSSLGDIVLSLPAIQALSKNFPDAKISWLIRPEFKDLIKNYPQLHEIIIFDRKLLSRFWYSPEAFTSLLALVKKLRKSKYDLVIDFQGLFRTGCLAWLSGCKNRIGMANAREFANLFYTQTVQQNAETIHLVDYYLKILKEIGAPVKKPVFNLPITTEAVNYVDELIKNSNIPSDDYAIFIPGAAHLDKCWPVERFARIAEKISTEFKLPVIAIGTKAEKKIAENLKALSNAPIYDFTEKTDLTQLTALLNNATIVFGNDTGPIHIAAALNTPTVVLFGRSNPARLRPYNMPDSVVAVEPSSRGMKPNSKNPKFDIKNITVEQAYRKICKNLET